MAITPMSRVVGYLRRVALLQEADRLTDSQLLESFLVGQEDTAFEALVRRHGPMILGVCRRVLNDGHDAEDAFQATFLVLLRKAASIGKRELVANWLHGVAYRTALKARKATMRRRAKERQMEDMPQRQVAREDAIKDMLPLLDQELTRLPDKYRVPIILCDLEGKTRKAAAKQLNVPEKTLSTRLERARAMLAKRLSRHGAALSGSAVALAVSQNLASASVPPSLVSSTVKIGALVVAGNTGAAGAISAKVAALTEGVVKGMLLTKLKTLVATLVVVGVVGIGAGRFSASASVDNHVNSQKQYGSGKEKLVQAAKPDDAAKEPPVARTFAVDDPTQATAEEETKPRATLLGQLGGHTDSVISVAFSPDGMTLASVSHDQTIKLWDTATGRNKITLKGRTGPAQPMAYSPDGKTLASGTNDRKRIMLWDPATGKEMATLDVSKEGYSFELAYSPDAKTLAVGAATIRLLEAKLGNEQAILKGSTGFVRCLAFSPDGKTLASTSDTTIKLWVVAAGGKQAVLNGHANYVDSVAFSPDGKTLASASEDKTIRLWDLTRGTVTAIFKGHRGAVYSVAFSPDGKTLASASRDQTIRLWDLATENETVILKGHTASVFCVAFSPDGKTLASASEDKTIKLWKIDYLKNIRKTQEEVVEQMKLYRALAKEGKNKEALAAALKAKELDPDNLAAEAAIQIATMKTKKANADIPAARDLKKEFTRGAPDKLGPENSKIRELLKERVEVLRNRWDFLVTKGRKDERYLQAVREASQQLLVAELERCESDAERLSVHLNSAKEYEKAADEMRKTGIITQDEFLSNVAKRLEAEIAYEREKAKATKAKQGSIGP